MSPPLLAAQVELRRIANEMLASADAMIKMLSIDGSGEGQRDRSKAKRVKVVDTAQRDTKCKEQAEELKGHVSELQRIMSTVKEHCNLDAESALAHKLNTHMSDLVQKMYQIRIRPADGSDHSLDKNEFYFERDFPAYSKPNEAGFKIWCPDAEGHQSFLLYDRHGSVTCFGDDADDATAFQLEWIDDGSARGKLEASCRITFKHGKDKYVLGWDGDERDHFNSFDSYLPEFAVLDVDSKAADVAIWRIIQQPHAHPRATWER